VSIKTPTTSYLIKQIANIAKGSTMPKKQQEGYIHIKEIYHLAILKKCDKMPGQPDTKALCKSITGTAKSMGIVVESNRN
jgi:large subunit ribosomal protein L11